MKCVLLLAVMCVAGRRVVLEPKPHVTTGFTQLRSRASPHQGITLHIALKHSNPQAAFERAAMDTAYGVPNRLPFFSPEKLQKLAAPVDLELVVKWLMSEGVKKQDLSLVGHGDWLQLSTNVKLAERLFQCRFQTFRHAKSGRKFVRAPSYSVPSEVAHLIDFVGGIKRLPSTRNLIVPEQSGLVGPNDIRALFNVPAGLQGSTTNGNIIGIAGFLGQYIDSNDNALYASTYNLPVPNITVVGPNDDSQPGVEAELDIDMAIGVAQGTPVLFRSTGGLHDQQEPFLTWLLSISSTSGGPYFHSASYGDVEASLDYVFVMRVNIEFMKLSAAGHTFFFASGDSGVSCNANNMQDPDFPASSPFVTSVGGVELKDGAAETWTGSGGGFSNVFGRPAFMNAAQTAYLNSHSSPDPSTFNSTSRGYPDISAISWNVAIAYQGSVGAVGGTSASCPQTASLFALLRDITIASGKSGFGYLNPAIYAWGAKAVNTVPAGRSNSNGNCQGFTAGPGWSPVNGFGIPDFGKISAML